MATQYDPIAKDASLNTTENPSRNLADVIAQSLAALIAAMPATVLNNLADVVITLPSDGQTLKYDAATQKWVNANDAGGHIIENPSGTDMTQRANLQFADAHLTDDSVNDRTEVENIKDITSADYASATEDGFYNVTDESDEKLTAADIAYDSNDSIKEKIDEVEELATGKVLASASGNGVKTYAQLLDEIASAIDFSAVTLKSKFVQYSGNTGYACNCFILDPAWIRFVFIGGGASSLSVDQYDIKPNNSSFKSYVQSGGSLTVTDKSANVVGLTIVLKLFA